MFKIDLSKDYDPDAVSSQKQFISDLGPYYVLVTVDEREAFNDRLENYWFIRWPLTLRNYYDSDFLAHRRGQIFKVNFHAPVLNKTI